jgi:hypothetical protein
MRGLRSQRADQTRAPTLVRGEFQVTAMICRHRGNPRNETPAFWCPQRSGVPPWNRAPASIFASLQVHSRLASVSSVPLQTSVLILFSCNNPRLLIYYSHDTTHNGCVTCKRGVSEEPKLSLQTLQIPGDTRSRIDFGLRGPRRCFGSSDAWPVNFPPLFYSVAFRSNSRR